MSNIERLLNDGSKNHHIFANTILEFMKSQGFYGRLYNGINEMNEEQYELLFETLKAQNFNDYVDVILWLES